jgi:hypothetical protein
MNCYGQKEEPKEVDKKKLYIKWGIIAGSIIIVVALVFAFMGGVLKIPFLNLSFSAIKKRSKNCFDKHSSLCYEFKFI